MSPTLSTDRLNLQQVNLEDAPQVLTLRSDPVVIKYIDRPLALHLWDVEVFIRKIIKGIERGDNEYWGIFLNDQTELIGTICLWHFSEDRKTAELGYDLMTAYHGQGIMSEAVREVIRYGFGDLQLRQLEAFTHRDNLASCKLLERNGFVKNAQRKDEHHPSNVIYELVNVNLL